VTDPVKVGDGVGAYARYAVVSRGFCGAETTHSVTRRFSDFTRLRDRLVATYPGAVLYPLPEKVVTTAAFHPEFLRQASEATRPTPPRTTSFARCTPAVSRGPHFPASLLLSTDRPPRDAMRCAASSRACRPIASSADRSVRSRPFPPSQRASGLTLFMSKLATNPIAAPSDELRAFLTTQEMPEDAEAAWYNRGAAGTALTAAGGWWNQLATATEAAVVGAKVETLLAEEDPKYLAATEYLLTIEERLKKLCAASDAVIASVCHVGAAASTFGERATRLGECEEKGAKVRSGIALDPARPRSRGRCTPAVPRGLRASVVSFLPSRHPPLAAFDPDTPR
jgi:hypothetical protein